MYHLSPFSYTWFLTPVAQTAIGGLEGSARPGRV